MPAHIAGSNLNNAAPGRSYNQNRQISPLRLALVVVAIASVAFAVYIAESYPKRTVHTSPRVYQAALPYDLYALEPSISAETMDYHYNKHDVAYDKKLQALVNNTKYQDMSLETIIAEPNLPEGIFNNAGQLINHNIFWESMTPDDSKRYPMGISESLKKQIESDFKTHEFFMGNFSAKAVAHFGSGWTWVLYNKQAQRIEITTTPNGVYAGTRDLVPLFNCDVWEHSYYIDYRNRRDEFIRNFHRVINWEYASAKFEHTIKPTEST